MDNLLLGLLMGGALLTLDRIHRRTSKGRMVKPRKLQQAQAARVFLDAIPCNGG